MSEREGGVGPGRRQRFAVLILLVWLGMALSGAMPVADRLLGGLLAPSSIQGMALLIAALAIALPYTGLILLLRNRPRWSGVTAVAAALLVCGGYLVLDGSVGVLLPAPGLLVPLRRRYGATGLRLALLIPFALVSARFVPRLVGSGRGDPLCKWLGLSRVRWTSVSLGLAAAAMVTVAWPVTGALGDSLESVALSVEVMGSVIAQVLVFWGVIFHLLAASFASGRSAAAFTALVFGLSVLGGLLPGAHGRLAVSGFLVLPLALLLAEIRVRGRGVVPVFPVAFLYLTAPVLFVDPRDTVATGIPEPQHVLSLLVVGLMAALLAAALWLGRQFSKTAPTGREKSEPGWRVATLVAVIAWVGWVAQYVGAGEPGFFNDGFLIILEDQADVSSAYEIADREMRLEYVYDTLVETANKAQGPIREELEDLGVSYHPHYIVNMVRVDGHRWLMGRFEGRPEVSQVILNPNVRKYPRRIPLPYEDAGPRAVAVQENITAIGADEVWAHGVDGAGVVVGGQDTGYDWEHPALRGRYRGWDGKQVDHDYNWHDAWDNSPAAFDDGSHGTHTMGTVLGDAGAGNRIGVAPGAEWIGCRNMRRGFGNPGSYAECMEFLFAPYPLGGDSFSDGDVSLGADVINNSWGCPPMEGCLPETLKEGVAALRAAGIMMVVSVGNDGPECGTATTPPANHGASFSVGATTTDGRVVGFSSRGPVNGLIKPDIAAPGERVRSSVPGDRYAYASGTSMAAPHVTGAIALVWSADPSMIGDVEATEGLLCRTAVSRPVYRACEPFAVPEVRFGGLLPLLPCACGDVTGVPNNVYGCGVIDAAAAVASLLDE